MLTGKIVDNWLKPNEDRLVPGKTAELAGNPEEINEEVEGIDNNSEETPAKDTNVPILELINPDVPLDNASNEVVELIVDNKNCNELNEDSGRLLKLGRLPSEILSSGISAEDKEYDKVAEPNEDNPNGFDIRLKEDKE